MSNERSGKFTMYVDGITGTWWYFFPTSVNLIATYFYVLNIQDERRLVNEETELHSAEEFEKLVLASPNSSMAWIRYMGFLLQQQQVVEAKSLGQRALQAISFR